MVTVGVAELKAKLSEYLARVRAGEEVVVTDRGRPIARIGPAHAVEDEHLAELERAGLVKIGTGISEEFLNAPRPRPAAGGSLLEALLEERREGR
jgi:prevent-host-death family protein